MAQPYPEDHVSQILGLHVHVTGVLLSSQYTGSQSILKLLNLNYIIMLLQVSIFQTQSMLCDASRACWQAVMLKGVSPYL